MVRLLEDIAEFLSKKGDELYQELKKLLDKLLAWIKKNKKRFERNSTEIPNLTKSDLDWMASRRIGNLGGNVLKASQIRKLRGILKKKGIQLIVEGDAKYITKSFRPVTIGNIRFEKVDDLFYFMRNNDLVGGFNAINKQMILPTNSTEIVVFHEMAHVKHFEEVGEVAYNIASKLDKEMYVWKQILDNRGKWTEKELQSSLDYINRIRVDDFGLEPLKTN